MSCLCTPTMHLTAQLSASTQPDALVAGCQNGSLLALTGQCIGNVGTQSIMSSPLLCARGCSRSNPGMTAPLTCLETCLNAPRVHIARRNARVWGVSEAAPGQKPVVMTATLAGKRDPGYWETSRMLLESGLCLALQVRNVWLPHNARHGE